MTARLRFYLSSRVLEQSPLVTVLQAIDSFLEQKKAMSLGWLSSVIELMW